MEDRNFGFNLLALPFGADEWCDADERMFQACFTILGQFVEEELGKPDEEDEKWGSVHRGYRLHSADIEEGDPSGAPPAPSSDRTAIDLWLWYKEELPKIEQEYADELHRCFGGDVIKTKILSDGSRISTVEPHEEMKFPHDYPEIVKDEKLFELMKLRTALWT